MSRLCQLRNSCVQNIPVKEKFAFFVYFSEGICETYSQHVGSFLVSQFRSGV